MRERSAMATILRSTPDGLADLDGTVWRRCPLGRPVSRASRAAAGRDDEGARPASGPFGAARRGAARRTAQFLNASLTFSPAFFRSALDWSVWPSA